MARVTVEDCIDKIQNRFELVMIASQRARKIGSGAPLTIDRDNDKNPVVSLREIAQEKLSLEGLKEELIQNYQRVLPQDDQDTDIDLMEGEEEWSAMASQSKEMYSGEEADTDDDGGSDDDSQPSLEDLAGKS